MRTLSVEKKTGFKRRLWIFAHRGYFDLRLSVSEISLCGRTVDINYQILLCNQSIEV
jgi:hypothetical protein